MLLLFYQTHFQQHLTRTQFLVLRILLNLLQSSRQVKLEQLALWFPYPITAESRHRKLQRFLNLPQLTGTPDWVSPDNLLIYALLPNESDFINGHRSHPMGIYKHTLGLPGGKEESYLFILATVTQALK
ncbi:hypothetical protein Q5691_18855 [Microcoleus sp. w1-18aA5]|uniref:hypothetical protein n=1 Tax=Microcoleus sp. w1-18aA5 TaxID=2818982 RepID=UPI002FCF2B5B